MEKNHVHIQGFLLFQPKPANSKVLLTLRFDSSSSRTWRHCGRSEMAPTGQTLAHWPQLMQALAETSLSARATAGRNADGWKPPCSKERGDQQVQ
jgi:hypothetical protein